MAPLNKEAMGKVFLGGTCGLSTWRSDVVIPALESEEVPFFNPQKGAGEWHMNDKWREEEEKKASWFSPFGLMPDHDTCSLLHRLFSCSVAQVFLFFFFFFGGQQMCKTLLFVLQDRTSEYSMLEIAHLVSLN